jgi:hypothetical protein
VLGGPAQNVANFVSETKVLAVQHAPAASTVRPSWHSVGAWRTSSSKRTGVRSKRLPYSASEMPSRSQ